MVAELTDIYTRRNVERKALGDTRDRPCRRPKWIETATREPIYSVLDVDDEPASVSRARANHPPLTYPDRNPLVIVISAAKDAYEPKPIPESIGKYDTNTIRFESEEEEALYSVVERGRRVRRTVDKTQRDEERLGGWLRLTSRRSVSRASRRYRFDEMYPNENDDTGEVDRKDNTGEENGEEEEEDDTTDKDFHRNVNDPRLTAVPVPRGIVGLVGPYRVYQNPNEKREYMLREEELVEDVVDSVSDLAVSQKNWSGEPRRRAKWKIREDDEETTLVPDIRRLPSFREYEIDGRTEQVDKVGSDISEWKIVDERCCNNEYETEDSKFEGNGFADKVEGILSGKGEHFDVDAKEISSYDDDGPTKEERGKLGFCRYIKCPTANELRERERRTDRFVEVPKSRRTSARTSSLPPCRLERTRVSLVCETVRHVLRHVASRIGKRVAVVRRHLFRLRDIQKRTYLAYSRTTMTTCDHP